MILFEKTLLEILLDIRSLMYRKLAPGEVPEPIPGLDIKFNPNAAVRMGGGSGARATEKSIEIPALEPSETTPEMPEIPPEPAPEPALEPAKPVVRTRAAVARKG
jgi:hypothetical protein